MLKNVKFANFVQNIGGGQRVKTKYEVIKERKNNHHKSTGAQSAFWLREFCRLSRKSAAAPKIFVRYHNFKHLWKVLINALLLLSFMKY